MKLKCFDSINGKEIEMPLEKVVRLLLPLNIDTNFHMETLKAQAVIIRTNLLRKSKYLGGEEVVNIDTSSLESCKNIDKVNKACKETKGIVILYNDKPINAKYHICCGGSTENVENVLGNSVVYLRKVLCEHCIDSPFLNGEKIFTMEEIEEKLEVKFPRIEDQANIEILNIIDNIEKDEEDRIISIKIGDKYFKGYELMKALDLNSTRFKIYPENVKFITKGYGHGLGFCQYGGEKMAQSGQNYKEILQYYYTGIDIKEFPLPCIEKPIYGKIIVIDPGHGGEDKGHKGVSLGLEEKHLTMELAQILKPKLESKGATVHLTREKDEKVLTANRIEITNGIQPDFFLSIHLDYYPNSTKKGLEIFYFQEDLGAQTLGQLILKRLEKASIPTRGIKEGNFYVFRGIKASSLLIEIGYLSNLEEEIRLSQEKYLFKMAKAIEKGILDYFAN